MLGAGEREALHVFKYPTDTFNLDGDLTRYGNEVVVIEGGSCWPNGDVEGVAIDGTTARIVARWPWRLWEQTCNAIARRLGGEDAAHVDRSALNGLIPVRPLGSTRRRQSRR